MRKVKVSSLKTGFERADLFASEQTVLSPSKKERKEVLGCFFSSFGEQKMKERPNEKGEKEIRRPSRPRGRRCEPSPLGVAWASL